MRDPGGRGWLVTDPDAEAGSIETLPPMDGWVVLTREELAASDLAFGPDARVAITTEAAMPEVLSRLDPARRAAIETLKDKSAFRSALAERYPDLDVRTVALDDLPSLAVSDGARYVVKPARGVFGTAVHQVDASTDLAVLRDRIAGEVARGAEVLSASALSGDRLVVEPYIEGEEYAVDAVFTMDGEPLVVGAYRHPMPRNSAYAHFRDGTTPDWSRVRDDDRLHVFFIAYNGATVDVRTHRPDREALRRHLDEVVLEVPFDHRRQLAFGVLYARQRPERLDELLAIEFDDLFVPDATGG